MPTASRQFVEREWRDFPPPCGNGERVGLLYTALKQVLPDAMNALADRDELVVAEIGEIHPDVRTFLPDGGYVITFTSGMLAYTELIAKICAATFVEGAYGTPSLSLDEVKALLTSVMQTYVKQTRALWHKPDFKQQDVPVGAPAAQFRDGLLECTRLFMLAHELGHVSMEAKIRPAVAPEEDEVAADSIGLEFALAAGAAKQSVRLAIAGAGLAIRLFVSLERFGVRFGSVYPLQAERLAALEAAARKMLASEQLADELSTVMVAVLDLMDDLDNRIAANVFEMRYTESRARIGLLARLIEVGSGHLSPEAFVEMLKPYALDLARAELGRTLNTLCSYYWDWADTARYFFAPQFLAKQSIYTHEQLIAISEALRSVVPLLTNEHRNLLDPQYGGR